MRRTLVVIAFVAITSLTSPISAADDDIRPCDVTPYGCCSDGITTATSKDKDGCPAGKFLNYLNYHIKMWMES